MLDSAHKSYEAAIKISSNYADAFNNLGSVLFDKGMVDEAIDAWERAIEINPNFADAYYNLGNVYDEKRLFCKAVSEWRKALEVDPETKEKRLFRKAISSWKRALEINPDMVDARYNLAAAYTKNKMYKEAISEYKQILIEKPNDPEALFSLGAVYRDKGLINKAIAQFKMVLAVEPENTSALDNMGLIHFNKGHYDNAVSVYRKSLQIEPDNIDTLYSLGLVHYYRGDLDEAIIVWEKVASINPFYKDVQKNLSLEVSTQREQDVGKVTANITNVVKGSPDEATVPAEEAGTQELFAISVASNSKQKDVTNQQPVKASSQHDAPLQVQPIRQQPEMNHSDVKDMVGQIGSIAISTEDKSSTEISTQKKQFVGGKATDDKGETSNVVVELHNEEIVPTSKAKAQEVPKISDDEDDQKNVSDKENLSPIGLAHLDLGTFYAEKGLIDEAILEFRNAVETNPHHLDSHVELGTAYGLKGLMNKSKAEFKKAIDIDLNEAVAKIVFHVLPAGKNSKTKIDEVKARINLGNAYKVEEKLERAKLEYEKVLELKPGHSIAKNSLSEIYYELGASYLEEEKYSNAINVFDKALDITPDFTQVKDVLEKAHYNLGINYAKNRELDKAIMEFNKILEIKGGGLRNDQTETPPENEVTEEVIVASKVEVEKPEFAKNQNESTFNTEKLQKSDEDKVSALDSSYKKKIDPLQINNDKELKKVELSESHNPDTHDRIDDLEKEEEAVEKVSRKAHQPDKNVSVQPNRLVEQVDKSSTEILDRTDTHDRIDDLEKKEETVEKVSRRVYQSDKNVSVQQKQVDKSSAEILDRTDIQASNDSLENTNGTSNYTDDNAGKAIIESETVSSYYITRNYSANTGYGEAIEEYEHILKGNPYDNNAHRNLAYAYYSKALHVDDAIAMREDARECNQNFLVKRFYLHGTVDNEESGKMSLAEHSFDKRSVALHNRSGNVFFKKEMFNKAIFEYRNALEINPKCSKALYNLAFSFFIKGSHIDVALRGRNDPVKMSFW
jgi:tetratricopeptide (TPR) repeat protein